MTVEVMKQALDVLVCLGSEDDCAVVVEALRQAIIEAEKHPCTWPACKTKEYQDQLATEVHTELIGLTFDELIDLENQHPAHESLSRAIAAKLMEKQNNGT
jgi:hypothetical protein